MQAHATEQALLDASEIARPGPSPRARFPRIASTTSLQLTVPPMRRSTKPRKSLWTCLRSVDSVGWLDGAGLGWMHYMTRYYEALCGYVWLGDGGRWQPVRLRAVGPTMRPAYRHAEPCSATLASGRSLRLRWQHLIGTDSLFIRYPRQPDAVGRKPLRKA
jgi:hypothetical protein